MLYYPHFSGLGDDEAMIGPVYDPVALVSSAVAAGLKPDPNVLKDAQAVAGASSSTGQLLKWLGGAAAAVGIYALLKGKRRR